MISGNVFDLGVMPGDFTVCNMDDETKRMSVHHMLSLNNCWCTTADQKEDCVAYSIGLHYADLCRALDFNPLRPLYRSGRPAISIPIVYPWDEPDAPPMYSKEMYGAESDCDVSENPFAWVDKVDPMVYIPIHVDMQMPIRLQQRR